MTSVCPRGTALVTGGAGFTGSHLVDRLVQDGWRVTAIDDFSRGKEKNANPEAVFYRCDLGEPRLMDILGKVSPEVVFTWPPVLTCASPSQIHWPTLRQT